MSEPFSACAVNTYSYIFEASAAATVSRLADQGYGGVELMFYPGHLWPVDLSAAERRSLRALCEARLPLVCVNMPNVDLNIAAAVPEMRAYTLDLLTQFLHCAGDLGSKFMIIGPGKPNPLFPMPQESMVAHFYRGLDRLVPLARSVGVTLLVENMPFACLPAADALMNAIDAYGDDGIRVIYDVANAHFIGEDPCAGLRRVGPRLALVHYSDTTRQSYRHDPLGEGDVPLEGVAAVLRDIGHHGLPMLEVISRTPDEHIALSCARLRAAGLA